MDYTPAPALAPPPDPANLDGTLSHASMVAGQKTDAEGSGFPGGARLPAGRHEEMALVFYRLRFALQLVFDDVDLL